MTILKVAALWIVLCIFVHRIETRGFAQKSFDNSFEEYVGSNNYVTAEMRSVFKKYWDCILHDHVDHILEDLHWMIQYGHYDDYFMILNYLVYVHDHQYSNPYLIRSIENLIHQTISDNIINTSVNLTNSVTYNIVRFLLTRFKVEHHLPESKDAVPYEVHNYELKKLKAKDIQLLISAIPRSYDRTSNFHYRVIVDYLNALPGIILNQINFESSARNNLIKILKVTKASHTISNGILNSANYYLSQILENQYNFTVGDIISALPRQGSSNGRYHYNILFNYFRSQIPHNLLQHLAPNQYRTTTDLVIDILTLTLRYKVGSSEVQRSCKYFLHLFKHHQQGRSTKLPRVVQPSSLQPRRSYEDNQIWSQLSRLLPAPTTVESAKYYKVMKEFLESGKMRNLSGNIHLDLKQTPENLLFNIIKLTRNNEYIQGETRTAAEYYLHYYNALALREQYSFSKLLAIIPQSEVPAEKFYYDMIKKFLSSTTVLKVIQQSNIKASTDLKQTLHFIFERSLRSSLVSMEYKHAIMHFCKSIYNESISQEVSQKLEYLLQELKSFCVQYNKFYTTISTFLRSDLVYLVFQSSKFDFTQSSYSILADIFTVMHHMEYLGVEIREAAEYFENQLHVAIDSETDTITKIHNAFTSITTAGTTHNYKTDLDLFLQGNEIRNILRHSHLDTSKNGKQLLYDLLLIVGEDKKFSMKVREASHYYSKFILDEMSVKNRHDIVVGTSETIADTHHTVQASAVSQRATTSSAKTTAAEESLSKTKTSSTSSTSSSSSSSRSSISSTSSTASTFTTSTSLTTQQSEVLQRIETELNAIQISDVHRDDQKILTNYLHTDNAYNILQTSDVNLNDSSSDLLAEFVDIVAHTNDIPQDIRVASEHYEKLVPKLKEKSNKRVYIQMENVDSIFHNLPKPTEPMLLQSYNAIDRYLHSDIPNIFSMDSRINIERAPLELLQDLVQIGEVLHISTDYAQTLIAENYSTLIESDLPLDHLYKLDKVFQLIEVPTERESLEYYYAFGSYLRGDLIYNLLTENNVDFSMITRDLLQTILTLSMKASTLTSDIVQSCVYFNNVMFSTNVTTEVDNILQLLPKPVEESAREKYDTINQYLHSHNALDVFETINLDTHRKPTSILINILDIASHRSTVSKPIRQAANYFLKSISDSKTTVKSTYPMYSHRLVHSMSHWSSLVYTKPSISTRYMKLLDVLPESFTSTAEFNIIKEYLTSALIENILTSSQAERYINNEEALLRLIMTKTVHHTDISEYIRGACAKLIKNRYFDCGSLTHIVPAPTFDEEQVYYNVITTYLDSIDVYYNIDLNVIEHKSAEENLKYILTEVMSHQDISEDIRRACRYYLSHSPFYDYGILIKLLPNPTSENIRKLYDTIVNLLQSDLVHRCTLNLYVGNFEGHEDQLLKEILIAAENCENLDENFRVAAKYYLNVIKTVSVSVQRVLTKTVDLNEIFSDAFDFSSFSKTQFDAYDTFFHYVSSKTQELLSSSAFDFWSEHTKRGEFTDKFLTVLSKQDYLPDNILQDILILKPLIQMDGAGAFNI